MLCFRWPGKTPAVTDSQARPWPFQMAVSERRPFQIARQGPGRFRWPGKAPAVSDGQARPRLPQTARQGPGRFRWPGKAPAVSERRPLRG